jgi:hypothetical protein
MGQLDLAIEKPRLSSGNRADANYSQMRQSNELIALQPNGSGYKQS